MNTHDVLAALSKVSETLDNLSLKKARAKVDSILIGLTKESNQNQDIMRHNMSAQVLLNQILELQGLSKKFEINGRLDPEQGNLLKGFAGTYKTWGELFKKLHDKIFILKDQKERDAYFNKAFGTPPEKQTAKVEIGEPRVVGQPTPVSPVNPAADSAQDEYAI